MQCSKTVLGLESRAKQLLVFLLDFARPFIEKVSELFVNKALIMPRTSSLLPLHFFGQLPFGTLSFDQMSQHHQIAFFLFVTMVKKILLGDFNRMNLSHCEIARVNGSISSQIFIFITGRSGSRGRSD